MELSIERRTYATFFYVFEDKKERAIETICAKDKAEAIQAKRYLINKYNITNISRQY
jgi:hypothetical protein